MQNKQIYIADTVHKTILLSIYEKEVISTQIFNRLHNISQNSTAYMTFPTNRTKRFEHSVGTMKLCGDIFYFSINNSEDDTIKNYLDDFKNSLIDNVVDKVILNKESDKYRLMLGDKNVNEKKLKNLNLNVKSVFYNNFIPNNISQEYRILYLIMFQAVRISGLLHDIGHPPFSHISENAINSVYKKIVSNGTEIKEFVGNRKKVEFVECFSKYTLNGDSQLHENMGKIMTLKMISDLLYSDISWCSNKSFDEKYFKILVFETVKCIFDENNSCFKTLHRIIDGIIDGDRLDYVCRDITNSGISGSAIEYDRLISSMKLFYEEEHNEYVFVTDVKTINTVEEFFFKRWNLYKNIIYHHRVIKTDCLLQNCIENVILDYFDKNEDESNQLEYVLPYDISGLWKAIDIAHSNTSYFNALIQWDDYWLFTILKKHYFSSYYDSEDNKTTKYQLEELLSNKKNYFSIIKNNSDFQILSVESKSLIEEISESKFAPKFKEFKDKLLLQNPKIGEFYILAVYFTVYRSSDFDFKSFLKDKIEGFIEENYNEDIEDKIIAFKEIKSGLSTEPRIYKDNKLFVLNEFSNVKSILDSERFNFPYFYIYLKFKDEFKKDINYENYFLEKLGKYIASEIWIFLKSE